jgi:hypothetical protein
MSASAQWRCDNGYGTHPKAHPVDQASGIIPKAVAILVESVISPTMLLITPMFPFRALARDASISKPSVMICIVPIQTSTEENVRKMSIHGNEVTHLITAPQKVLDSPKQNMESDRPNKPERMTGFLPIRSDSRPQCRTVIA